MRNDLIDEMRSVAQIFSMRDPTTPEFIAGRLLEEAADELYAYKVQCEHSMGLFLSGDNVLEQVKAINKFRMDQGYPPL
jgi:hypothetical protein